MQMPVAPLLKTTIPERMKEEHQTEISQMGEFGLIEHLTKDFPIRNPQSRKGIGDDAAVLSFGEKEVLVTTDLLLEGIHFDLRYVPLKHLGYKAAFQRHICHERQS